MSTTGFRYTVQTPEGAVAQGECDFVVVPTTRGEMGVLADHASAIASVAPGELRVVHSGNETRFHISSGLVEVLDNVVRLFVGEAGTSGLGG